MNSIFVFCCDLEPQNNIHLTTEQCTEQARLIESDPTARCYGPSEHHPFQRRVDLQRGKWTYVILAPGVSEPDKYEDATGHVLEAFRTAYHAVRAMSPGRRPRMEVRKGLAYGFIVSSTIGWEATIIPTPRYALG